MISKDNPRQISALVDVGALVNSSKKRPLVKANLDSPGLLLTEPVLQTKIRVNLLSIFKKEEE